MPHADEVRLRPARGNVGNAAHLIQRHARPAIGAILFRAVPGFITKFPRVRHGVKSPQKLARHDIKSPDVFFETGHHDNLFEDGGPGGGRAKTSLRPAGEQRVAIFTKGCDHVPGVRIQCIEIFAGAKHHPFLCTPAALPINQPAKGRAPFRFEAPRFRAILRMDADHEIPGRGSDHQLAHDDRITLQIIAGVV